MNVKPRRARALPLPENFNTAHPPIFGIGGSAPYDPRRPAGRPDEI